MEYLHIVCKYDPIGQPSCRISINLINLIYIFYWIKYTFPLKHPHCSSLQYLIIPAVCSSSQHSPSLNRPSSAIILRRSETNRQDISTNANGDPRVRATANQRTWGLGVNHPYKFLFLYPRECCEHKGFALVARSRQLPPLRIRQNPRKLELTTWV